MRSSWFGGTSAATLAVDPLSAKIDENQIWPRKSPAMNSPAGLICSLFAISGSAYMTRSVHDHGIKPLSNGSSARDICDSITKVHDLRGLVQRIFPCPVRQPTRDRLAILCSIPGTSRTSLYLLRNHPNQSHKTSKAPRSLP